MKKGKADGRALKVAHCPRFLTGRSRECWLEIVKQAPAGALVVSDRATVSVLACAQSLHEEASAKVIEFGPLVMAGTKPDVNPWIAIQHQQALLISKASKDLGLKNWRDGAPATRGKKQIAAAEAAAELAGGSSEWGDDLNPHAVN